jgi:hypothetical protein
MQLLKKSVYCVSFYSLSLWCAHATAYSFMANGATVLRIVLSRDRSPVQLSTWSAQSSVTSPWPRLLFFLGFGHRPSPRRPRWHPPPPRCTVVPKLLLRSKLLPPPTILDTPQPLIQCCCHRRPATRRCLLFHHHRRHATISAHP